MTGRHDVLVRVLRVFTDDGGHQGNALGVIDGTLVDQDDRQRVAHELGFSETIFIDDHDTGELRIFTPAVELPLAGHPLVGAAWLLLSEPRAPMMLDLRPPGGLVHAWTGADERTVDRGAARHAAGLVARPVGLASRS
jgi:predicted PhzF superfamily epimerase YddE/YHI9